MDDHSRNDNPNDDVEYDPHALANAASFCRGSFWADAMRDLALEGSSSEERLARRARNVRAQEREEWTVADPAVELPDFEEPVAPSAIELPSFREPSRTASPSVVALPAFDSNAPENDKLLVAGESNSCENTDETAAESVEPDEAQIGEGDFSEKRFDWRAALRDPSVREFVGRRTYLLYAAVAETFLCPPCGVYALHNLLKAFKNFALENYSAADERLTRARRVLKAGQRLILFAFIVAAAILAATTLIGSGEPKD